MSELHPGPWVDLSIDFCSQREYLLVITDDYSRYPVVEVVWVTSADTVIPYAEKAFAMYLRNCDIKHWKITPLWHQAESLKPLMKAVRAATAEEVTGNDNCTSAFKPNEPAHSARHIVSYWTMNPE